MIEINQSSYTLSINSDVNIPYILLFVIGVEMLYIFFKGTEEKTDPLQDYCAKLLKETNLNDVDIF